MEQLGSKNLRAVFDFANFLEVGQPTIEAFQRLRPYIEYVHIKDASKEKQIVPAGHGIGQVEEILGRLLSSGWTGFLSLEPHLTDFAGLRPFPPCGRFWHGWTEKRCRHDGPSKMRPSGLRQHSPGPRPGA